MALPALQVDTAPIAGGGLVAPAPTPIPLPDAYPIPSGYVPSPGGGIPSGVPSSGTPMTNYSAGQLTTGAPGDGQTPGLLLIAVVVIAAYFLMKD